MNSGAIRVAFAGLLLAGGLHAQAGRAARQRPAPALPTLGFERAAQWVDEGALVVVPVLLSEPSRRDVRVSIRLDGSALLGDDFALDEQVLLIEAGRTRGQLLLSVHDDGQVEPVETIQITLFAPKGARLIGTQVHTMGIGGPRLGGPMEGLTPDELAAFRRGRPVFEHRFTPSEGLGPFYNATSCASCHSTPVAGGSSPLYRNFYLGVYQFGATPGAQSSAIPPFLSQVIPAYGSGNFHADAEFTLEGGRPLIPDDVFGFPVISAQRNSVPTFGVGLFEFVSDDTILEHYDPFDSDNDGISGQVNTQLNGTAIGRMGLKAQVNNIELFTRGPLQAQMGITSEAVEGGAGIVSLMRMQVGSDPNDPTEDDDGVPDPEISHQDLSDLIAFARFLAPPAQVPFSQAALDGQAQFDTLGCTSCHLPSLASSRGPVEAYTDLLLHDVGVDLVDNIQLGEQPAALTEFRTQPLWGVSLAAPYLHDGRAATLSAAIEAHGGEAAASRDAYLLLSESERENLITFLEHL